jgi:hypothetical protein
MSSTCIRLNSHKSSSYPDRPQIRKAQPENRLCTVTLDMEVLGTRPSWRQAKSVFYIHVAAIAQLIENRSETHLSLSRATMM